MAGPWLPRRQARDTWHVARGRAAGLGHQACSPQHRQAHASAHAAPAPRLASHFSPWRTLELRKRCCSAPAVHVPPARHGPQVVQFLKAPEYSHFKRIVFDTAPTGHTLRLLSLPDFLDMSIGGAAEACVLAHVG